MNTTSRQNITTLTKRSTIGGWKYLVAGEFLSQWLEIDYTKKKEREIRIPLLLLSECYTACLTTTHIFFS